ncbi:PTS transporter subunit EIIC [Clostridium sp. AL.422]|uniref:PTS sugar transporter subunit IIC n=1 Tax=Clostridium TaxID=1485 RepID=UPI00293DB981|nr:MULTISPECIES: PTS transporter subunit EIIC [unclassified Clostridium]MDV4151374.1 PTS transporter subunit EIIC [Clostridium sp. AL.422]
MSKFVAWLEKYVGPLASKIEKQRHISTIKNGMISLMAVLMVGSISMIVGSIGNFLPEGSGVAEAFNNFRPMLNIPFTFTFGILSIYCAITISYSHSRQLKLQPMHAIVAGVMSTVLLCTRVTENGLDIGFLDSRGLFIAIFASIISVELMNFLIDKKITLRIQGLPDMIGKTFEAILPLLIIIISSMVLSQICISLSGGQIIPEVFTTMLAPAVSGIDTVGGVFLVCLLEMLFWFFGLNGYAILVGFTLPFMTHYLGVNAEAFQAGMIPPHVFTENFWGYFMACTGSGLTGALAILALRSKSSQLRAAGKAGIIPAVFNISEPVVYGLPVAYNPYLFIPFVLGTPVLSCLIYGVFRAGIIRNPVVNVGGMPTPIAQYLITLDWKAPIFAIVIIIVAIGMYYPFFKMYEKSVFEKEKLEKDKNSAYDSLGLDF